MNILGIDTAQKNLGLGVICAGDPGSVVSLVHFEKFKPETTYPDSDFVVNALCIRRIRELVDEFEPEFACLESAALAASHGMVSIGTIHGAIMQALVDKRIPFVYCTPKKHKKFLIGNGNATKTEIKNAIKVMFDHQGRMNADEADAVGFALIGLTFAWIVKSGGGKPIDYPCKIPNKIGNEIFFDLKSTNKRTRKPAGIMHRPNEFFWIPHEKEYEYV